MADSKITALTALTTADPATDMFPVVDVSDTTMAASGTTKRISINNILACSPTATLASATITGDLTVDTSTLKVDSANNRVGVGTASPGYDLEVAGSVRSNIAIRGNFAGGTDIAHLRFVNANGSIVGDIFSQNTNGGASDTAYLSFQTASSGTLAERYRIAGDGVATWSNVGGVAGTAMTLNSTGLGIGVTSALSKLTVAGSNLTTASWGISSIYSTDSMAIDKGGSITFGGAFTGTTVTYFAQISGRKENSTDSDVAGYLALSSRPTGGLTTDRMRVKSNGQIRFIPLAADPSGAEAGDVYYNSTSNKLKCYNGTTWNDLF